MRALPVLLLLAPACTPPAQEEPACADERARADAAPPSGDAGAAGCETGLIYVADDLHTLVSFDPEAERSRFTPIGRFDCPTSPAWPGWPGALVPFSVAVDRAGRAWVLYTSGELFWVDTTD